MTTNREQWAILVAKGQRWGGTVPWTALRDALTEIDRLEADLTTIRSVASSPAPEHQHTGDPSPEIEAEWPWQRLTNLPFADPPIETHAKLSWPQFRFTHRRLGLADSDISPLWKAYKEGSYSLPTS